MLTRVKGALSRVPVLGYALHWAVDMGTLPLIRLHLRRDIREISVSMKATNQRLLEEIAELRATVTRLSEGQQATQPSAVYLGDGRLLVRTWQGLPLICDSRDLQITPKLVTTRTWEPLLTIVFQRLMRRGFRYLEGGGHIGYFAIIAAALVGPDGWVEVYEPNPCNFRLLSENVRINHITSMVRLHPCALSNEKGRNRLHVFTSNAGSSSLSALPERVTETFGETPTEIEVETTRLDDQYRAGERFDFMKLDVEGAEDLVLQGGARFLQECLTDEAVLTLEFNRMASQGLGLTPTAALDRLRDLGFSVVVMAGDGGLHPYESYPLDDVMYADVLARRQPWPASIYQL